VFGGGDCDLSLFCLLDGLGAVFFFCDVDLDLDLDLVGIVMYVYLLLVAYKIIFVLGLGRQVMWEETETTQVTVSLLRGISCLAN
jgi:hypothetical protein